MQVFGVVAALTALDGSCLTIRRSLGPSGWDVTGVAPEARRAVGQWPAGESLIERLATGISQAAGHEKGPGQRRRLLSVARGLGGAAKAIAINAASEMLERRLAR